MAATLVLVHMQPKLACMCAVVPIVPQVLREIRRVMKEGGAVVVLELDPQVYGSTDAELMTELQQGSASYEVLVGAQMDAADLALLAIRVNGWSAEEVRVVGVNTASCVFTAVAGLCEKVSPETRLVVVADACNDQYSSRPWEKFQRLPGVVLSKG
jgi:hypothetical protein